MLSLLSESAIPNNFKPAKSRHTLRFYAKLAHSFLGYGVPLNCPVLGQLTSSTHSLKRIFIRLTCTQAGSCDYIGIKINWMAIHNRLECSTGHAVLFEV